MSSVLAAIREQNRLLTEQNALLSRLAEQKPTVVEPPELPEGHRPGMMTGRDLTLILTSDNIMEAIDRWNACCDRAKGRKGR